MKNKHFISVIVPCRNEINYIESFLTNLISQDYNKKYLEIIIVDGNSSDGTTNIIKKYIKRYKYIKLLYNPSGYTPISLNMGIKRAKGDIIIRMDVHSEYPSNYISKLIKWLKKLKADNVGGKWEIVSKVNSLKGKAIAFAYGLPISVGNVQYRLGTDRPREVDTVPFGCYPATVFKRIGLFDEEFIRNQDDEFNFRLKQAGGKIYLVPDVVIKYFARENFSKLFKQYFQYGFWKVKLFKKFKKLPSWRHFIPVTFFLFLLSIPFFFIWSYYKYFYLFVLFFYFFLLIFFSLYYIIKRKFNIKALFHIIYSIIIIHISYGMGFLTGIFYFLFGSLIKKSKR